MPGLAAAAMLLGSNPISLQQSSHAAAAGLSASAEGREGLRCGAARNQETRRKIQAAETGALLRLEIGPFASSPLSSQQHVCIVGARVVNRASLLPYGGMGRATVHSKRPTFLRALWALAIGCQPGVQAHMHAMRNADW